MVNTFRKVSSGIFVLEGIATVGLHYSAKLPREEEGSLDVALKAYFLEKGLIQVEDNKIYLSDKSAEVYSKLVKLADKEVKI